MDLTLIAAALAAALGGCSPAATASRASAPAIDPPGDAVPPVATKRPHPVTVHGDTRADDYYWMREKSSPEVMRHLEAENEYARAVTAPIAPLEETIYREIRGHIQETDMDVPYQLGRYEYYTRTERDKAYPIFCRKGLEAGSAEQVLLDLNQLAAGQSFLGLGAFEVSPDGKRLAYSLDTTGFRSYTAQILDLETGQVGPERIEKAKGIAWAADNHTLFYTTDDRAKRSYRLYRHELGSDASGDPLIYEETDERFGVDIDLTRSGRYLVLTSASSTTSEVRVLPADAPRGEFRLIAERAQGREYYLDHRGDQFYIRTNDRGRNFRMVTAPVTSPGPDSWKEFIGHRDDVMIAGFDVFATHYAVQERAAGLPRIRVGTFGGTVREIPAAESAYSMFADRNHEFETDVYRYRYESLVTPSSVYDYSIATGGSALRKRVEVLGGYDPSRYAVAQLPAPARDGVTEVPVSLVYRKDLRGTGPRPLWLDGYGSYGYPYDVDFSAARLSLLDRGVIFAIAHIRGGGEMGKQWHDDGRMFSKLHTFTDFIDVAQYLVDQGYTSPDRLAISGRSAGGLLIGAVVNMRPDLFRVAVAGVPFVDVINTMLDESLPLTIGEFEEWGNPKIKEQYDYIKRYSPYTNIRAQDYPAMLVYTSLNDSQVMYWEPAKYVAKLREYKTDQHLLVLKVNMAGGHSGSSGRYDALRERAFQYAFVLWQLGVAI